jgi:hypothetical protein
MKKIICIAIAGFLLSSAFNVCMAQDNPTNLVHITKLKLLRPDDGSMQERDSLIAIYNKNVIQKNEYILSHREYAHFFTDNSSDYMIVEEFKDFDSWQKSVDRNEELENAAWPDEAKRKAFMDAMNRYFENWHGDMLMSINPALSKN